MNGFDKEFGKFTIKKLTSRDFCKADKKEKCRNIVSIYSEKCKECYEDEERREK